MDEFVVRGQEYRAGPVLCARRQEHHGFSRGGPCTTDKVEKPLGNANTSTKAPITISVYVISILENFSRMLLTSAISERQDTVAYLRVLAHALRNYGAPEAIVMDSGGVFYSKRAVAIYEALDIRKERIDPRQSWQNYIEAHFGIMRRLADYYLNKAPTLEEMRKAHRKFIRDYNCQIHFAHWERNDNRHSPQDVLRGVLARTLPAPTLARIFFATEFTRHEGRDQGISAFVGGASMQKPG